MYADDHMHLAWPHDRFEFYQPYDKLKSINISQFMTFHYLFIARHHTTDERVFNTYHEPSLPVCCCPSIICISHGHMIPSSPISHGRALYLHFNIRVRYVHYDHSVSSWDSTDHEKSLPVCCCPSVICIHHSHMIASAPISHASARPIRNYIYKFG
jgi:hypothetical protein